MAIEPAFMQVISKNINYSKNEVELKMFETQIKSMIKLIGQDSLDTKLEDVVTRTLMTDYLFANIRTKQEGLYAVIESYVNEIKAYATANYITLVPSYATFTYTYAAITAANIQYNDDILDGIVNEIMNNEGYFWERRLAIREMLDFIRDYAVTEHILNLQEHYPDEEAILTAIAYNDLILDDLINYIGDGDEVMLLKQKTATQTGSGTTYGTLASDEILYSIDNADIGTAVRITVGVCKAGAAVVTGEELYDSTTASKGPVPIESTLSSFSCGTGTVPYVTVGTSGNATMTYTVQKIVVYV